jgi:hypothetical protein
VGLAATSAACGAPGVLFGAVGFPLARIVSVSSGRSAAVVHVQPRQHVTEAGDPQLQRVKYGPTGLVCFYGRWDSWAKAEGALTVT